MPSEPIELREPSNEDAALLALRAAVATLDPPPTSIDVAGIARRSAVRSEHRRSVVRRSAVLVAVAASAAGVITGVVHLSGVTATAVGSSSSGATSSAPLPAAAAAADSGASAPSPPSPSSACPAFAFAGDVSAEGPGADTARAALQAWLERAGNLPRRGWRQQPSPSASPAVDFTNGTMQLHTADLPGRGWFVTGGTPC